MNVAIYCRVSKEEQAQEGLSLGAQEERCRAFAFAKDWNVVQVYVDAGASGKSLQRPAMQRLIADAQQRVWDVLLVWKLDRLSRRQRDVLYLLEDVLNPANIGLQSATEAFDTTTPMGKAMLGMLAVFAQLERETIVERVRMGRAQSLKLGRWQGGKVPYGYLHQSRGLLAPDPTTAVYVRELFAQAAQGIGTRTLAKQMNALGIPAPEGGRWFDRVIWGILQNPVYHGEVGRFSGRAPGHHAPLIDDVTWESVQRWFAQRRQGPRTLRTDFLVDALLSCPQCGEPMRGYYVRPTVRPTSSYDDPIRRYRFYYICARRRRLGRQACDFRSWHAPKIDAQAVAIVHQWHLTPSLLEAKIYEMWPEPAETGDRTRWNTEWTAIQTRAQRWYDAFESGAIDATTLRDRLDRLRQTQAALEAQRPPAPSSSSDETFGQRIARLHAMLVILWPIWDRLLPSERVRVIRCLVHSGTINDQGTITLQPTTDFVKELEELTHAWPHVISPP